MNFTIRAFVGETRVSTAISYSKDNKNHIFQSFPEKKKFPSLRNWMMFYTKKNANTSFKMEPSSNPKPVVPDTPTQALVRKYYNAFGFENTITPRSYSISQTALYVYTNNNFYPVFFNRQTGMVRIGSHSPPVNTISDINTCKFFVKRGIYDFQPATLPVASEPNPGQPVIAFSHRKYNTYFNHGPNYVHMKKAFTEAGYFVKDFYVNNYKKVIDAENAIWSTPGIRALAQPLWWYISHELDIYTSRNVRSRVKLNEWLAANPATSSPSSNPTTASYPPLPPSPAPAPSTTVSSPV